MNTHRNGRMTPFEFKSDRGSTHIVYEDRTGDWFTAYKEEVFPMETTHILISEERVMDIYDNGGIDEVLGKFSKLYRQSGRLEIDLSKRIKQLQRTSEW